MGKIEAMQCSFLSLCSKVEIVMLIFVMKLILCFFFFFPARHPSLLPSILCFYSCIFRKDEGGIPTKSTALNQDSNLVINMTQILRGTLKFSGLGVWVLGNLFVSFGNISFHCLFFHHLTDCRLGRRMANLRVRQLF